MTAHNLSTKLVRLTLIFTFALVPKFLFGQEPPVETGTFREPDLVEVVRLDRTIRLDIRYATSNNFVGRPVYKHARLPATPGG